MKLLSVTTLLLSTGHLITSSSIPSSSESDLIARESTAELILPALPIEPRSISRLTRRKGGGGGRSSGSSSGGSSRSSGSGGAGGRPYSFSPVSNVGGRTRYGSGPPPSYGGYYAGGARVPYSAGGRSPTRGLAPLVLPITAFAFFPALWLYGSLYAYPFGTPYYYRNATSNRNQTVDVTCLCQEYSVCGCDDNGNSTYIQQVIGDGTDRPVNSSQVVVLPALANGTQRAYINGTLPNGTTAPGGTDPSSDEEIPNAAARAMASYAGYWVMVMTVVAIVLSLQQQH